MQYLSEKQISCRRAALHCTPDPSDGTKLNTLVLFICPSIELACAAAATAAAKRSTPTLRRTHPYYCDFAFSRALITQLTYVSRSKQKPHHITSHHGHPSAQAKHIRTLNIKCRDVRDERTTHNFMQNTNNNNLLTVGTLPLCRPLALISQWPPDADSESFKKAYKTQQWAHCSKLNLLHITAARRWHLKLRTRHIARPMCTFFILFVDPSPIRSRRPFVYSACKINSHFER